ncbi:MAG: 2-isopropylmalate synthase [Acidobacteria bacterium]|nr:2-isopropylmalate synthase [Acidobacteriota bacterium]MBI3656175.1 2-isopropylmalate synthase [Acidobacteriota bacterium]
MHGIKEKDLVYDWNTENKWESGFSRHITFDDETLRDGLQSPSVKNPAIDEKIKILHLIEALGIESVNIGLPGAGPHVVEQVTRLAQEIVSARMRVRPNCAARTIISDIKPVAEISQKVGLPIEVATFIGSSPVRQYVEDWSLDTLLRLTEEAVTYAVKEGLPPMYVTEDTTRAHPDTISSLYSTAISCGAQAIVICDTVGHATPSGARNLIRYVREKIVKPSGEHVRVDWHGHMDRGLGVINSIAALEAGADQTHGTALGLGERVGNTPMDQLLVNLQLMGYINKDLSRLQEYCRMVSQACGVAIPPSYPVVGADAFRTGTGVHAAAVIKAMKKGDLELANLVYSGVPAHQFGFEQIIEIGPMSGKSNVIYWLEKRGYEARPDQVDKIFAYAKESDRLLTDVEIVRLMQT